MKNKYIYFVIGLFCIGCSVSFIFSNPHTKIDYLLPNNATAYIFIDSISPTEKKLLNDEDYEYLKKTFEKIKYYNPNIDPTSSEYMIWGNNSYAIEIHSEKEEYTISIGEQEIESGIRTLCFSNSSQCLAAYVSDETFLEISAIFQKNSITSEKIK